MKSSWKLIDVEEVIRLFPEQVILCGGQAVAYWAWRFRLQEVVSKDIDVVAERGFIHRLHKLNGGSVYFPDEREMTNFRGRVSFAYRDQILDIEALHAVPGLEDNAEDISLRVELPSGGSILVLHPVALCQSKLYNVRHFNQANRNDLAHLRTAMKAAALWLGELAEADDVEAVFFINRWFRTVRARANLRVLVEHGIDWTDLVPLPQLQAAAEKHPRIASFLQIQWPRMKDEILRRTADLSSEPEIPES